MPSGAGENELKSNGIRYLTTIFIGNKVQVTQLSSIVTKKLLNSQIARLTQKADAFALRKTRYVTGLGAKESWLSSSSLLWQLTQCCTHYGSYFTKLGDFTTATTTGGRRPQNVTKSTMSLDLCEITNLRYRGFWLLNWSRFLVLLWFGLRNCFNSLSFLSLLSHLTGHLSQDGSAYFSFQGYYICVGSDSPHL